MVLTRLSILSFASTDSPALTGGCKDRKPSIRLDAQGRAIAGAPYTRYSCSAVEERPDRSRLPLQKRQSGAGLGKRPDQRQPQPPKPASRPSPSIRQTDSPLVSHWPITNSHGEVQLLNRGAQQLVWRRNGHAVLNACWFDSVNGDGSIRDRLPRLRPGQRACDSGGLTV